MDSLGDVWLAGRSRSEASDRLDGKFLEMACYQAGAWLRRGHGLSNTKSRHRLPAVYDRDVTFVTPLLGNFTLLKV
jgi:hypothetical protein